MDNDDRLKATLSQPLDEGKACFYDLALSIRQKIYHHAMVPNYVFVRPFWSYVRKPKQDEKVEVKHANLALLRASKQIYQESMPMFLGENTFQIIHTDMLAVLSTEYPRVRENLKMIRKVELIFDVDDCPGLLKFMFDDMVLGIIKLRDTTENTENKNEMLMQLLNASRLLRTADIAQEGTEVLLKNANRVMHDRQTETQKIFLWGRTMTFVREQFKLSRLHVNLKNCFCTFGCCRLAGDVLGWGWIFVWVLGVPEEVTFRGASRREVSASKKILEKQTLRPGMMMNEIYDDSKVPDPREIQNYQVTLSRLRKDLQCMDDEQISKTAGVVKALKWGEEVEPAEQEKAVTQTRKKYRGRNKKRSVCPGCGRA
jgi:hypothetical protein